jgi:hypothetical protein
MEYLRLGLTIVVIFLLFGLPSGFIASLKNRSFWKWAIAGVLFNIITLVVIILMDHVCPKCGKEMSNDQWMNRECSECGDILELNLLLEESLLPKILAKIHINREDVLALSVVQRLNLTARKRKEIAITIIWIILIMTLVGGFASFLMFSDVDPDAELPMENIAIFSLVFVFGFPFILKLTYPIIELLNEKYILLKDNCYVLLTKNDEIYFVPLEQESDSNIIYDKYNNCDIINATNYSVEENAIKEYVLKYNKVEYIIRFKDTGLEQALNVFFAQPEENGSRSSKITFGSS